jgi:hypothetical protein
MSLNFFQLVCEQNGNAKCLTTPLSGACGGWGCRGKNWPTKVVKIAILYEFDENDRFFTTSIYGTKSQTFLYTNFTIKRSQWMAFKKTA